METPSRDDQSPARSGRAAAPAAPRPTAELLAPAGDERALRAALAAGADAVYFGLERWSARAFAGNFAGDEAARAVELAHAWGARAHLALNTLLKDEELGPALEALEAPYLAGLDALIVADLGFVPAVRQRYPDLALHASTQLLTHSSSQLAALASLGFTRAILARELSLDEIAALDAHGLELEAFVHGALCYAYSGDCLLSSMVGGRSGNRGRCSQSCRMRYRLTAAPPHAVAAPSAAETRAAPSAGAAAARSADDAAARSADDATASATAARGFARVLSTADLCAIAVLPRLLAAGVTSFKIEGRMKDAAYVTVTTAVYREALDAALADPEGYFVRPAWLERLEQSFSRGFTTAHLEGRHSEVRSGGRGGHRGVLVGRVERYDEDEGLATVRLSRPVAAGDLVCLYTSWGQTDPVRLDEGAAARLTLRTGARVAPKDRLFRLAAAEAGELARELTAGRRALRSVPLEATLEGRAGEPARLTLAVVPDGPQVSVTTCRPLAAARTAALDEGRVRAAVGALGGTPYELRRLDLLLEPGLFLAVADLKDARRRALAALDERRIGARRRQPPAGAAPGAAGRVRGGAGTSAPPPPAQTPTLRARSATAGSRHPRRSSAPAVVLRLRPGETPLRAPGIEALCLDVGAADTAAMLAGAHRRLSGSGLPVRCRLPEILFDDDRGWLAAVLALPWAGLYVRHLGVLAALADVSPATDIVVEYPLQGLNGAAARTLAAVAGRGLAAVVASPEASLGEIAALAAALADLDPPATVEVLAFGRQQVLHARDHLGCAEGLIAAPAPDEHVALLLEDARGYVFPADVDARGTRLFNAHVTDVTANLDELRAAGVATFAIVQRDLEARGRRALAGRGLSGLAGVAGHEPSTTGHLFRGVA